MNIDAFEKLFHPSWWIKLRPFLETKEFENIWLDLKDRTSRGKIIFPYSSTLKKKDDTIENCIFRAFKETPYDRLKVVMLGLSPYHTLENNKVIADGLCFSTQQPTEPPSLKVFYDAIEKDVYNGLNLNMKRNPNLQFLAEQGVLLLNAALTCETGMPTVHLEMWKPFMDFFFKEIINNDRNNLHLVFWGEDSSKYSKLISRTDEGKLTFEGFHYVYEENHPAYYARDNSKLETNLFTIINERLKHSKGSNICWDESTYIDYLNEVPF